VLSEVGGDVLEVTKKLKNETDNRPSSTKIVWQ